MGKFVFFNKEKIRNFFIDRKTIKITTFLLLILSFVSIIIINVAKDKNHYTIEAIDTTYISLIRLGETNYPFKVFVSDGILIENEKLVIEKGKVLEFEASKILNVKIVFDGLNSKYIMKLNNEEIKSQNDNIYINESRFLTNIYEYLNDLNFYKYVYNIIFIIVLYFLVYYCTNNILNFIFNNIKTKILQIIKFFVSFSLMYLLCFNILLQFFGFYLIIPLFILLFIIILYYKLELKNNLNKLFVIFGTIFGLTMAFALPPFHVPDEASHFFKSFSILSQENALYNQNGNRITKAQLLLTTTVQKPIDKYNMDIFNSEYTISAKEYFVDLTYFLDDEDPITSFYFGNTSSLPNLCYIPSAIIAYVGLKLDLPFMLIPLLSRMANLLIFVLCGYYAITITPKFKKMFISIMLLPITLQQAIGINQDSITNSLIFFTVALLFYYIYEKKNLTKKSFIIIFILSILLGFCKIGYYPLLFLLLLIPSVKFTNKKTEILFKTLTILPCVILSFKQYLITGASYSGMEEIYYPISTIYNNPLLVIKICLNTILGRFSLDLLTGLVDGFGWSTVWHVSLIQFIASTLYFLIFMVSGEKLKSSQKKHRYIFALITILMLGMIYSSLLFGWTKIGMTMIDGLQCRYFIPIALFLYISLSNKFINIKSENYFIILSIIIVNILAFFTIINSYYV